MIYQQYKPYTSLLRSNAFPTEEIPANNSSIIIITITH